MRNRLALVGWLVAASACKPSTSSPDAPIVVASVVSAASAAPPAPLVPAVSSIAPVTSGLGLAGIPNAPTRDEEGPNDVTKPPDTPKGDVAVVSTTVSGGTSPDAARVVAGLRPRFRQCYQKGLAAHPKTAGNVTITAKIDPNGEVNSATNTAGGGLEPEIAVCMARAVQRATFSAPGASGATITVKTKLVVQTP